jgi:hypothetical protein
MVEFLVREIEVRLELDHVLKVVEWAMQIQEDLKTSLTSMSPIFKKKSIPEATAHFDPEVITTWR